MYRLTLKRGVSEGFLPGVDGVGFLAASTRAENLQPVTFDPEVGLRGEIFDEFVHIAALEFDNVATPRTHHMMTMSGTAQNVAMGTVRLVNTIENLQIDQDIDRPEDGGPADSRPATAKLIVELLAGKHAVTCMYLFHDFDAWIGHPESGLFQLLQRIADAAGCLTRSFHGYDYTERAFVGWKIVPGSRRDPSHPA
jgi:hypothetical protein